jgi:hypothetical protein
VESSLVEEPISAELVLVDRELARRARVALPDPPWLLPVLAEPQQAEVAAPRRFSEERSARPMPRVARRPRHRSVDATSQPPSPAAAFCSSSRCSSRRLLIFSPGRTN